MNGKKAKAIRRFAFALWSSDKTIDRPFKNFYRHLKRMFLYAKRG